MIVQFWFLIFFYVNVVQDVLRYSIVGVFYVNQQVFNIILLDYFYINFDLGIIYFIRFFVNFGFLFFNQIQVVIVCDKIGNNI